MTDFSEPIEGSWTEHYLQVRQKSLQLCKPLRPEDHVPQAAVFVSPAKWHLAHSSWFFEEFVLKANVTGYQPYHPDFNFLFNSYYNSVGSRTLRHNRGLITRPDVQEVLEYRQYIDDHMVELLQGASSAPLALVELGLQHEQQHQELLLTDIKYLLHQNPILPAYQNGAAPEFNRSGASGYAVLDQGLHTIGYAGQGFHFDNEKSQHNVYCERTEVSRALVSNGEYLEFMDAGGYRHFRHWLDEGWKQQQESGLEAPLYWHLRDGQWFCYTLAGLEAIDLEAPVCHINFYEAAAFASWRGMRLLTEFEWEAIQHQLDWGTRWEWTHSAYLPYPGFETAAGAVGEYNGKFMMNQMVLRGASLATASGHSRATYRNFFPPDASWQFSGIRLAKR
ncbi:MAG: ergothioneine biosynthesis protein EgtB [Bacteroidetes bacterium]|nr:ergothioneine biosynthesis protein EgtB [Bacteroidota bacterium]